MNFSKLNPGVFKGIYVLPHIFLRYFKAVVNEIFAVIQRTFLPQKIKITLILIICFYTQYEKILGKKFLQLAQIFLTAKNPFWGKKLRESQFSEKNFVVKRVLPDLIWLLIVVLRSQ